MKARKTVEVELHVILTSTLDKGECSVLRLSRLTPGERVLHKHWIRGRVGYRAGLDALEKRIISCPCRESNSGLSVVQPIH
jgi:hypothetical protein